MGLFPQQFIDDLKLQANIVQVIQEYVPLRAAGTNYRGLCPFHGEKTPSFNVNMERRIFHCFGCGAKGDVFKFVELHEKVSFPEAVRLLAQKFGMPLPEMEEGGEQARRDAKLRESLLKIHEIAAAYFQEQLTLPAGARARQQLKEREVTEDTIGKLGLGYAPRDGLKGRLQKQGVSEDLMIQSGLVSRRDNGDLVDRFRHRLMVPICRDSGSVIAFGGRVMEADQNPKYLNSPETAIYSKGRTLYGLNLTKAAIAKQGFVVLVEGYFDFAQVFQSQAAPVVASCGTALTPQQAQLLRRFTSQIVLSYDPDAAGQGAAARSCELLVAHGFDVNVAALNDGEDPDTFIRRQGPERYRERLKKSRPYLEYLLDQAATGLDFGRDDQRRQFLSKMLTVAAQIPEAAARDQFADRIAHKARITEGVVRDEIRKLAVNRRTSVTERELPSFGNLKDAEKALIWWLIHGPAEAFPALAALDDSDLAGAAGRPIFEVARALQVESPELAELLPSTLTERLSMMEGQLVTRIASGSQPPAFRIGDCIRALKRRRAEREHAAVRHEINRLQELGENGAQMNVLLAQMRELAHRIEDLR
ncbi:MAG TPA: DNA primase [Vicinamibacterales bacterium]|nr:DNA primase [Vicinamibacterales bacterium]